MALCLEIDVFYVTITGNFNFEASPLMKPNHFWNTGVPFYYWKYYDWNRNMSI